MQWIKIIYAFLMAITCNILWLIFRHCRPLPLGPLPEQNYEIVEPITSHNATTPIISYAGARLKQRTAAAFNLQLKPEEETTQRRWLYHIPLESLVPHKLPPWWVENEEVIHRLWGKVRLPPPTKPKVSLKIDELTTAFLSTFRLLTTSEPNTRV